MVAGIAVGIELSWERCRGSATGRQVRAFQRRTGGAKDQWFGLNHFTVIGVSSIVKHQLIRFRRRIGALAPRRDLRAGRRWIGIPGIRALAGQGIEWDPQRVRAVACSKVRRASARSRPRIESAGPRPRVRPGKCRLLGLRGGLREGLGGRCAAGGRTDYGAAGIAGQDEEYSLPVKSGRASGVT